MYLLSANAMCNDRQSTVSCTTANSAQLKITFPKGKVPSVQFEVGRVMSKRGKQQEINRFFSPLPSHTSSVR